MIITSISIQAHNSDRVNINIDGKFRFSLDIAQLAELGIKPGEEIDEEKLAELETESQFGKLYMRALEYALMRPRSEREMRDYLYRKTRPTKYKSRQGEIKERSGYPASLASRVLEKLVSKNYVNDDSFARWWVESRYRTKGASSRKLIAELQVKGVAKAIIDQVINETDRNDSEELAKIIARKRSKYPDDQKLIAYLARQGFGYDDIKQALTDDIEH